MVAFTEYGDRPLLIVYDLETNKRRKILRCAEFKSHEVISLAFSHDSKYLLAQGSAPDFQLVYFFWEKGKVITTSRTVTSAQASVTEVSFHPKDHDIVCIIGRNTFRMCRLIEGERTIKIILWKANDLKVYCIVSYFQESSNHLGFSKVIN